MDEILRSTAPCVGFCWCREFIRIAPFCLGISGVPYFQLHAVGGSM